MERGKCMKRDKNREKRKVKNQKHINNAENLLPKMIYHPVSQERTTISSERRQHSPQK